MENIWSFPFTQYKWHANFCPWKIMFSSTINIFIITLVCTGVILMYCKHTGPRSSYIYVAKIYNFVCCCCLFLKKEILQKLAQGERAYLLEMTSPNFHLQINVALWRKQIYFGDSVGIAFLYFLPFFLCLIDQISCAVLSFLVYWSY